jgi:uncharacterized protein
MGLDFFRRAVDLENKYRRPGTVVRNNLQTNGTLLDEEWCAFLRDNDFVVGLNLDGPKELHDLYRVDEDGRPTFDRAMRGLGYLQKHAVRINVLTTVHSVNADYPLEVYRFLRDEAAIEYIQFVPVVERLSAACHLERDTVTDRSVGGEQFGRFLIAVFDEWARRDVGRIFVQAFGVALAAWTGRRVPLPVFAATPGHALALEHNGDSYSCDQPKALPRYCRECSVRFACNGGCPKDRFVRTPDGEPNLNYLCAGYKAFFEHIDRPMRRMAALLHSEQISKGLTREPTRHTQAPTQIVWDELTSQ